MKNRKQCIQDTEDQTHEGMEGEENEESCSCSAFLYDGNTCPICLNCLLEQEIGFPENCSHTFCMTCILKWAEDIGRNQLKWQQHPKRSAVQSIMDKN